MPLNRKQMSAEIKSLSQHMDEIASNMVDFAMVAGDDWKEVLQHAFQLHGAAYAVKSWADGILEEK